MNNKKGISGTITVILLILCVIVLLSILFLIIGYFTNKAQEDTRIKVTTSNIELEKNMMILDKDTGKLQINIKIDTNNTNISLIKAVVLGSHNSGSYLIFDIPEKNSPKTYILNVSMIGDINEILIYPLVYSPTGASSKTNVLTKRSDENVKEILIYPEYKNKNIEYFDPDDISNIISIDNNAQLINPEADSARIDCISDWECEEWSTCHATYTLDNAIDEYVILTGEMTRLCKDNNKCICDNKGCDPYLVDRKECEEKSTVRIVASEIDDKRFIEVYDKNNNLVTKLEFFKGEHSRLDIDIPII